MKKNEIREWGRFEYKEKCDKCERELLVTTQEDNYPEYKTEIYVRCECGNFVKFRLPVN